jgi:hypothetical protein
MLKLERRWVSLSATDNLLLLTVYHIPDTKKLSLPSLTHCLTGIEF